MIENFAEAAGSTGLLGLYIAGMLVLWHAGKSRQRGFRDLFWYALITALIIHLPVGRQISWLLPMTPILLCLGISAALKCKEGWQRAALTVAVIILLLLASVVPGGSEGLTLRTNAYGIPEEEYRTLQTIEDYKEMSGKETIRLWGKREIMEYARRFDPYILMPYDRSVWMETEEPYNVIPYDPEIYELYSLIEVAQLHRDAVARAADSMEIDVLVLANTGDVVLMDIGNYHYYTGNENYLIYIRKQ